MGRAQRPRHGVVDIGLLGWRDHNPGQRHVRSRHRTNSTVLADGPIARIRRRAGGHRQRFERRGGLRPVRAPIRRAGPQTRADIRGCRWRRRWSPVRPAHESPRSPRRPQRCAAPPRGSPRIRTRTPASPHAAQRPARIGAALACGARIVVAHRGRQRVQPLRQRRPVSGTQITGDRGHPRAERPRCRHSDCCRPRARSAPRPDRTCTPTDRHDLAVWAPTASSTSRHGRDRLIQCRHHSVARHSRCAPTMPATIRKSIVPAGNTLATAGNRLQRERELHLAHARAWLMFCTAEISAATASQPSPHTTPLSHQRFAPRI